MATFEKRNTKEGIPHYRVKIRMKGRPPVSESFQRLSDARKWAQTVEYKIRSGRYFGEAEASKHTLSEAIDRYAHYLGQNNPRRLKEIQLYLNWWRGKLGSYTLSDISRALVTETRDALIAEKITKGNKKIVRSNATINRYVSVFRTLLNLAAVDWEWIETNPIKTFRNLSEPKGRNRYLSDDERHALLAACKQSENPYLYAIVILAISCGARKSEISRIMWDHVHLSKKMIVLPKTKNMESRVIHLHGEALSQIVTLYDQRQPGENYVFPAAKDRSKPIYFKTSWNTALKRANLKDFRFHDLRHTAASYLAMNGANVKDIADILGHKSLAMTNRYAHLCDTHRSKVVESMNDKIFGNEDLRLEEC